MFMMSDQLIKRYRQREGLIIDPFSPDCCRDNAYYFRLGEFASSQKSAKRFQLTETKDFIEIAPFESFWVKSRERFTLPDRILVQIGQPTALATKRHVQLIHGPSINPGYGAATSKGKGADEQKAVAVEVVLFNFGADPVKINYGDEIGKLTFFDISDSSLHEARVLGARERQKRLRSPDPYETDDDEVDAY
jgi:deoxycytidine triphosphate deaminase